VLAGKIRCCRIFLVFLEPLPLVPVLLTSDSAAALAARN
jgi:hypothetical protein